MKRWIAAVLVVVGVALGTAACGDDDDGVIEAPSSTTLGTSSGGGPGTTRSLDYSG